ncbi:MAG: hypothetical protein EAZ74_01425 [Alphaproteobacteria bacterium]|nr:MAG: hypothetical protein EAY76_04960 [Alphaproteobacteria bacterium]TAF15584.1 MAG: hypothetical protein EAZ74_01425 [Alphaproteobacteria bacterium]TAF41988.1 MAG: hypothetical protein EAZ66_00170 [Alphaproteobacteria bacterium]TAF76596.1 MAG: hypothetical protein EAZ52_03465 [Alphaproteobacteria bacterium]
MKKLILAGTVALFLGGCVSSPPEDYFIKIGKECNAEYNYVEPYLKDIPHPNSEKVIECTRKKVLAGYEAKEIPLEMFGYLDRRFDYNLLLLEKRKKGEITREESLVMLNEWDEKEKQLTIQILQTQQQSSNNFLQGIVGAMNAMQPAFDRYNMEKQGINPYTGIPFANERRGFSCYRDGGGNYHCN